MEDVALKARLFDHSPALDVCSNLGARVNQSNPVALPVGDL